MSEAKVELGRHLFFDRRLSFNGAIACSDCHQPPAYNDARPVSKGALGDSLSAQGPSLINLAWRLSFGPDEATSLEAQMLKPLYATLPIEMGLSGNERAVLRRFEEDVDYVASFKRVFGDETVSIERIIKAIASFERTLISGRSSYDRWLFDDIRPSEDAVAGLGIFMRLGCSGCHGGVNLSGDFSIASGSVPVTFFDTGTGGNFRVPSLRNVAATAPYFHDGRSESLEAVIGHYASGPNPAIGLAGFNISELERTQLLTFLQSLSDEEFLGQMTR